MTDSTSSDVSGEPVNPLTAVTDPKESRVRARKGMFTVTSSIANVIT